MSAVICHVRRECMYRRQLHAMCNHCVASEYHVGICMPVALAVTFSDRAPGDLRHRQHVVLQGRSMAQSAFAVTADATQAVAPRPCGESAPKGCGGT